MIPDEIFSSKDTSYFNLCEVDRLGNSCTLIWLLASVQFICV